MLLDTIVLSPMGQRGRNTLKKPELDGGLLGFRVVFLTREHDRQGTGGALENGVRPSPWKSIKKEGKKCHAPCSSGHFARCQVKEKIPKADVTWCSFSLSDV